MLIREDHSRDDLGFGTERTVAVFDFDDTLSKGDSMWPFLFAIAGRTCCFLALVEAAVHYGLDKLFLKPIDDEGTYFKERLLPRLLAGKRVEDLKPVLEKMVKKQRWLASTLNTLRIHYAVGHHIVIASGSLDLYLPTLLEDIPYHALICTDMEVKAGRLTGRMLSGNCVRARKAQRVEIYLNTHGPFAVSWGYGNAPHDIPMLDLLQHRVVI